MFSTHNHSRKGIISRRVLALIFGVTTFIFLTCLIGLYVLGRTAPQILDSALRSKADSGLVCEINQSNLILGNLDLQGIKISSPGRWKEKQFLSIKTIKCELNPLTFILGGSRHFKNVELDIDKIVLVGSRDYMRDNNAQDILKGLKSSPVENVNEAPSRSEPAIDQPKKPFQIDNLRLRVGQIIVVVEDGNKPAEIVVNNNFNFVFEAKDITEKNYQRMVSLPLGAKVLTKAATLAPRLMMDISNRSLRRSITEKFLENK
ncbi:MAG: hypothetical protein WCJ77_02180 [Opitutae bacterium]